MSTMIATAIANRSVIAFDYEGTTRFVEPHALGRTSKDDLVLRGFQTGGDSNSINFGWKLFTVAKMFNIRLAPPRRDYNPNDKAMTGGIVARLEGETQDA